jgi:hypothetical protein
MQKISVFMLGVLLTGIIFTGAQAEEVEKGKIPAEQLASTFKKLPWGVAIWDVDEAVTQLKSGNKTLWIDTRPESFFKKGTVQGAILLEYNKQGKEGNAMTQETLAKAVSDAGMSKDDGTIVMFCQGPECHRSYNATFVAVNDWGYSPERIVWFRAGYPLLFNAVKDDPKLKRKAKKYLSDEGVKQL